MNNDLEPILNESATILTIAIQTHLLQMYYPKRPHTNTLAG